MSIIYHVRDKVRRRNDRVHSLPLDGSAQEHEQKWHDKGSSDGYLLRSFLSVRELAESERWGLTLPPGTGPLPLWCMACVYVWYGMLCVCILYIMAWLTFKDVLVLAGWRMGEACIQQRRGPCGERGKWYVWGRRRPACSEQTEQGQGWMTHSWEAGSACTALVCSLLSLGTGKPEGAPLGCSAMFSLAGARCRGPGENQGGATTGRERCIQIREVLGRLWWWRLGANRSGC